MNSNSTTYPHLIETKNLENMQTHSIYIVDLQQKFTNQIETKTHKKDNDSDQVYLCSWRETLYAHNNKKTKRSNHPYTPYFEDSLAVISFTWSNISKVLATLCHLRTDWLHKLYHSCYPVTLGKSQSHSNYHQTVKFSWVSHHNKFERNSLLSI